VLTPPPNLNAAAVLVSLSTRVQVLETAANPAVEVCWYFPTSREQYRLSGVVDIAAADTGDAQLARAREAAWAAMSDAGAEQEAP
jgi:hypothetical protein